MTGKFLILALLLSVLLISTAGTARSQEKLPAPQGPVSDFAKFLTANQKKKLSKQLNKYRRISGHDVVVVTVKAPVDRDYAANLFSYWRDRRAGLSAGAMLLMGERGRLFLLTGQELRPPLSRTDKERLTAGIAVAQKGVRSTGAALVARADSVIAALDPVDTESAPEPPPPGTRQLLAIVFFGSTLVLPWLSSILTREHTNYGGAYAGAVIAVSTTLIAGPAMGAAMLIILCPLGLVMDRLIKRQYHRSRASGISPAWWAGGNWF